MDPAVLENMLLSYGSSIFINGKLNYGSIIWAEIAAKLNTDIKPQSLYLIVSQNRYNILCNLKSKMGIKENKFGSNYTSQNESEDDNASPNLSFDYSTDSEDDIFILNLDIPYEDYFKMKPVIVKYKNKNNKKQYTILKPGTWTNIMFDHFYKKSKLPCC